MADETLTPEQQAQAAELERLRAQLPEGMKHCTIVFKSCPLGHGRLTATNWIDHSCQVCEMGRLTAERDKLAAFKAWVHNYLDAKGIPHHPPGTHGKEGCRIGDRMDYVFVRVALAARLAERLAEIAGLTQSQTAARIAREALADARSAGLAGEGER